MKQAKTRLSTLFNKYKKYILYIIVGSLTTLINLIIYAVIRYIGMSLFVSNLIAFIGAVIFAYITNKYFVFQNDSNEGINLKEFGKFAGMRVGSFVIETILLVLLVQIIPYELIMKVLIGVIVIILNYVISNKFIFK